MPSTKKRTDYLSYDDYFMGVALLSAQRSKDPNRQVGACIINSTKRIVGIGYNGFPTGCSDDELPWSGKDEGTSESPLTVTHPSLNTKYPYVCHAELNAIVNSSTPLAGCVLYCTLFPCNECTKLIIQANIKEVVFLSDKNHDEPPWVAARTLLDLAKITYRRHSPQVQSIDLNMTEPLEKDPTWILQKRHEERGATLWWLFSGVVIGILMAELVLKRKTL